MIKIINYAGNKSLFLKKLFEYIPEHDVFIEPFLGSGVYFLNKNLVEVNYINDNSKLVYDFFNILSKPTDTKKLMKYYYETPIYLDVLKKRFKSNNKFIKISAWMLLKLFAFRGDISSIKYEKINPKYTKYNVLKDNYKMILHKLLNAKILNTDAIKMLKSIKKDIYNKKTFAYLDPPYLKKSNKYESKDVFDLEKLDEVVSFLEEKNVQICCSEHENSITEDYFLAKNYKKIVIGKTWMAKNNECIFINY